MAECAEFNGSNQSFGVWKKQKLRFYALDAEEAICALPMERRAIQEMNNSSSILANHEIVIEMISREQVSGHDAVKGNALIHDVLRTIAKHSDLLNETENTITFPLILGPQFSSWSTELAPAANAFSWSFISSAATSVSLSDTASFPGFYRTVSSDKLNVDAVIALCSFFNWTSIAAVYTTDTFGTYFANGLLEEGQKHNVDTKLIPYGRGLDGYQYAVETLAKFDEFIVIVIVHWDEISGLFQALHDQQMMQFPYYYIGVNSWFTSGIIEWAEIAHFCHGLIGALPWIFEPGQGAEGAVSAELYAAYDIASSYADLVGSIFAFYRWDTVHGVMYAMDIFDKRYNLSKIDKMSIEFVSNAFHDILLNEVAFEGLTGNVSFDQNGDRKHEGFGNVVDRNATIAHWAYMTDGGHIQIIHDNIVWPDDFVELDTLPRSHQIVTTKKGTSNPLITIAMTSISCFFIGFAFIYIFLLHRHRRKAVIKSIKTYIATASD